MPDERKKGIEILEKNPEAHGAKTSLLRQAVLNEIRALVDELDPRVSQLKRDSVFGGDGWPNRDREELARMEICLLLELLPRLDEGPF